jgi:hypothetical protein
MLWLCPTDGRAQAEVETGTGTVKIKYCHPEGTFYLDEVSSGILGVSPDGEGREILVEPLGEGRYLLATDLGPESNYPHARFLFNDRFAGAAETDPNCYPQAGTGYATFVPAIPWQGALYVPGEEQITDASQLAGLAGEGRIRKIELAEENNFVFTFTPVASLGMGETYPDEAVVIESETGGRAQVDASDLKIRFTAEPASPPSAFLVGQKPANPPATPEDTIVVSSSALSSGEDDRQNGTISVALTVPSAVPPTLTFSLTLPDGLNLNAATTSLVADRTAVQTLALQEAPDGSWTFEIQPKSGSATAYAAGEIVNIAFTVDESVGEGTYEAQLNELSCTGEDLDVYRENISVQVSVGAPTGNETVAAEKRLIHAGQGILTVRTPVAEEIALYDVAGVLLLRTWKPAGKATFDVRRLSPGILIARGSSGWTGKIAP